MGEVRKDSVPGVMSGGAEESVKQALQRKQVRCRRHGRQETGWKAPRSFAHLKPFVTLAKAVSTE